MKRPLWIVLALAACGPEADPVTVRERISALVPSVGNGAADALQAVRHVPAIERLGSLPGLSAAAKPDAATEPPGDRLARWLNEHVFVEAGYEGDGVYRVVGTSVCGGDAECARSIDQAQVRIGAEIEGDGLRLSVLVGVNRNIPISFEIRADAAKVTVDVAEIAAVASALWVDGIAAAEGRVSARLARLRARIWTVELAIEEDVHVEGTGGAVIAVAASHPTLSATVDLDARTLAVAVDLGALMVRWPWEGTMLGIDLPGVTGTAALGNDISVTALGFGDRTAKVTLGAEPLVALDWNPEANRRASFTLAEADGISGMVFSPRLDVFLTAHLEPLTAYGKSIEPWLMDEEYEFHFGTLLEFLDGGGVKVWGEPLSLAARKAGASLTVPTEMCLFEDELSEGEQPLIGRLTAGACPVE